jgi:hypothetical protein
MKLVPLFDDCPCIKSDYDEKNEDGTCFLCNDSMEMELYYGTEEFDEVITIARDWDHLPFIKMDNTYRPLSQGELDRFIEVCKGLSKMAIEQGFPDVITWLEDFTNTYVLWYGEKRFGVIK